MVKENSLENRRNMLKEKYKSHGLNIFEKHEILELALSYILPKRNTNELAHKLLNKFGSIHQILQTPVSTIKNFENIGEEGAYFMKFLSDIARIYMNDRSKSKTGLHSLSELDNRLFTKLIGKEVPVIAVMLLNAKRQIIYEGIVYEGAHSNIDNYTRKIMELVISHNAAGIILAHNHVKGIAYPSKKDIENTKKFKTIFDNMNVILIDHIISADGDYVSMRQSRETKQIFEK